MQDNGSWAGPAYVWKSQGIRNAYWQEVAFGDGFDIMPDPDDSRYGYAMSQQGYVVRYDRLTGYSHTIRPTHPDPDLLLRFNWNAAIAQDPFDNSTIYFGSQFVHRSNNKGRSWDIISPDLTTNDPEKQKQHISGGITIDATGAENNTTILVIEPSSLKKGLIWVGTDDGKVQLTQDGGQTWTDLSNRIKGMPEAGWVAQIKASHYNAGEAFLVVNNYRNFDYQPYLFHTTNYGKTWKSIVDEKQVWNYTLSFIQDPEEPNLMFLGTEGGLYFSIDAGKDWQRWTAGYPSVPTMDLVIHPREGDLVIGTFGRSIYVLDDIRPLRALAKKGEAFLKQTLATFEPATAFHSLSQQASGTRFGANAIYNGENRSSHAMISYLINKPEPPKKKEGDTTVTEKDSLQKVKFDSLTLEVFTIDNRLIRTIHSKAPEENGLHRMYWRMDEKGVDGPSRNQPNAKNEPSGIDVLPGKYKMRLSFGGQVDSAVIEVKYDPRVEMPISLLQAKRDFHRRVENNEKIAGLATQRLIEADDIVADYSKRMKALDAENFKDLLQQSKLLKDSIEQLMQLFMGEDNSKKQGIIRSPVPNIRSRIGAAYWYLNASPDLPAATEERLLFQLEEKLDAALKLVNDFFEKDWRQYRAAVEREALSPFKDYAPLKRE